MYKISEEESRLFFQSVAEGDDGKVKAFFSISVHYLSLTNLKGETALNIACALGHYPMANYILELLKKNGNRTVVNLACQEGYTPLHLACWYGSSEAECIELIQNLINNGADVNTRSENGATPIYTAAAHGDIPIVKVLIDNGADVNAAQTDNYISTMRIAFIMGNKAPLMELLISTALSQNPNQPEAFYIRGDEKNSLIWHDTLNKINGLLAPLTFSISGDVLSLSDILHETDEDRLAVFSANTQVEKLVATFTNEAYPALRSAMQNKLEEGKFRKQHKDVFQRIILQSQLFNAEKQKNTEQVPINLLPELLPEVFDNITRFVDTKTLKTFNSFFSTRASKSNESQSQLPCPLKNTPTQLPCPLKNTPMSS